jgi:hypothetical protein
MLQVGKEALEHCNYCRDIVADMLGVEDTLPVVGRLVEVGMLEMVGMLVEEGMLEEVGILVVVDHTHLLWGAVEGRVEGRVEDSRVLGNGVHRLIHHLIHPLILQ